MPRGYGSATHGTANATASSGQLIAANPDRKYLHITNDGTADVYLSLGTAAAVANQGLRLSAAAGERRFEMSGELGNVWTGQINAITVAGSSRLIYVEGE